MVDDVEKASNFNKAEAEKAKARADEALSNPNASSFDVEEVHRRLEEADARLKALNASNTICYSI